MVDRKTREILTVSAIGAAAGLLVASAVELVSSSPKIVSMVGKATPNSKAAPHVRTRSNAPDAAVLHQMGFSRGNDPHDYLRTTAHYIVLPDGGIYQLYDHSTRLPASNGFNSRSVAIEFAGNFPSRSRSTNPDHWWYPKGHDRESVYQNQLTVAQARSGRALIRYLRDKFGITHVFAHRQSSASRGNDPGPDVWGAVGQWAVHELGMSDGGPSYAIGSGAPIRDAWRDAYAIWNQIA